MNLGIFQVDMPPSYHSPLRKPSPTNKTTCAVSPIIRHIAVEDNRTTRLDYYFDGVCQFIDDALSNPLSNVLVHCYLGMSRSSTLVAAYLLWRGHGGGTGGQGMDPANKVSQRTKRTKQWVGLMAFR